MLMIMSMAKLVVVLSRRNMGQFVIIVFIFFLVFYPNTFQKGKTVTW